MQFSQKYSMFIPHSWSKFSKANKKFFTNNQRHMQNVYIYIYIYLMNLTDYIHHLNPIDHHLFAFLDPKWSVERLLFACNSKCTITNLDTV